MHLLRHRRMKIFTVCWASFEKKNGRYYLGRSSSIDTCYLNIPNNLNAVSKCKWHWVNSLLPHDRVSLNFIQTLVFLTRDPQPLSKRVIHSVRSIASFSNFQIFLFSLTHCGRVTQICVFNTVKLGTSASSP